MFFLVVDDVESIVKNNVKSIKKAVPSAEVHGVTSVEEALSFCENNKIDIAFLDVEMPDGDGISLAKKLKSRQPGINIIFVTAYGEYALDSYRVGASYFLMKPMLAEDVIEAMNNLRNPIDKIEKNKLELKCFGMFEVMSNGKPYHFKYNKSKELFAYLAYRRGVNVSTGEIIGCLWEDEPLTDNKKVYVRKLISDIKKCLNVTGFSDFFVKSRGSICFNPDKREGFLCDWYEYIDGNPLYINKFTGEFMTQYYWAEEEIGNLINYE